jgi:hypothetical protein
MTTAPAWADSPTSRAWLPRLKGYAVTGDFEGHLSIALGLASNTLIRVGELSGRVYLDVSY